MKPNSLLVLFIDFSLMPLPNNIPLPSYDVKLFVNQPRYSGINIPNIHQQLISLLILLLCTIRVSNDSLGHPEHPLHILLVHFQYIATILPAHFEIINTDITLCNITKTLDHQIIDSLVVINISSHRFVRDLVFLVLLVNMNWLDVKINGQ